jgi:hypothetical protein
MEGGGASLPEGLPAPRGVGGASWRSGWREAGSCEAFSDRVSERRVGEVRQVKEQRGEAGVAELVGLGVAPRDLLVALGSAADPEVIAAARVLGVDDLIRIEARA